MLPLLEGDPPSLLGAILSKQSADEDDQQQRSVDEADERFAGCLLELLPVPL